MKKIKKNRNDLKVFFMCSILTLIQFGANVNAQLAFPTAEGYGKNTVGGRGGTIYEVTNLNDAGPGSLRAAVEASGPRIVVFRVSGTINLTKNLTISNPNITIAGQTAPGDGICIKKYTFNINADQVIVRYIRARYGDELKNDADAVSMRYRKNIIIDHVSASWGDDETLSLYHGENITVQWCMITETLNRGGDHGFAGIWGSPYSSFHHNLVAHCVSRNMRFASGCGNTDYRNNVIYNWGYNSSYGGEQQQVGNATYNFSNINMVNNYYKPGPATQSAVNHRIVNPTYRNVKTDYGKFYVAGNYIVGNATVTADNWNGGVDPQGGSGDISYVKLNNPWPAMAINQQSAQDAYQSVVTGAGCSYPKRDAVDTRIINEVKNGTATYGANGIIESQSQVGGWPTLNSTAPPADSDHDGMPDSWETANGLNPNNAADRNNIGAGGYTMVEIYINSLVDGATNVPVSGISISPAAATIGISQTMQLAAIFSPSNASNQNVTWSSNNTSVATVSVAGVVTGVNAGTAVITVTSQDGGHTGSCQVTITSSSSAMPLIKMLFNENTGSSVANTGSVSTSFTKTSPPAWSANVPVNGGASALDFGTTTGNYYVESGSVINQLAGLSSFTITGWVASRHSAPQTWQLAQGAGKSPTDVSPPPSKRCAALRTDDLTDDLRHAASPTPKNQCGPQPCQRWSISATSLPSATRCSDARCPSQPAVSSSIDSCSTPPAPLLLLKFIDDGQLPETLAAAAIVQAAAHPDANVRALFERHIPAADRPQRLGEAIKPADILALAGDAARGAQIFAHSTAAQCQNCHAVAGQGSTIGPDLSADRQKIRAGRPPGNHPRPQPRDRPRVSRLHARNHRRPDPRGIPFVRQTTPRRPQGRRRQTHPRAGRRGRAPRSHRPLDDARPRPPRRHGTGRGRLAGVSRDAHRRPVK